MRKSLKICSLSLIPVAINTIAMVSCSNKWKDVEKLYAWWDKFVDNNQLDFYNNLTVAPHNWYKIIDNDGENDLFDFSVSSHAEAIMLWAYGAGYGVWNTSLHNNKGTSGLDNDGSTKDWMVAPDPKDPYDKKGKPIVECGLVPHKGYKYLDDALNLTTTKNTVVGYHGFEDNECELRSFIEDTLSINLEDDVDLHDLDLTKLIGKSFTDFGYLALSTYESNSMNWVENILNNKYKVAPYLEVVVPPQIHAAYISYSKRKFYDGVFLSWPREFQLLCQRNLTITVTGAEAAKSWNVGRQLLKIRCVISIDK